MRKVINKEGLFTKAEYNEEVELYTLDEIKNYPGISKEEIEMCETIKDLLHVGRVIGFVKDKDYTDTNPTFVQMYENNIEEV